MNELLPVQYIHVLACDHCGMYKLFSDRQIEDLVKAVIKHERKCGK